MKIDAYFKNISDATKYLKKNSDKIIVVDEREEKDLFGNNKKDCLFVKAKEECKCKSCRRRRDLEIQLVISKINMEFWNSIADVIRRNKYANEGKTEK